MYALCVSGAENTQVLCRSLYAPYIHFDSFTLAYLFQLLLSQVTILQVVFLSLPHVLDSVADDEADDVVHGLDVRQAKHVAVVPLVTTPVLGHVHGQTHGIRGEAVVPRAQRAPQATPPPGGLARLLDVVDELEDLRRDLDHVLFNQRSAPCA